MTGLRSAQSISEGPCKRLKLGVDAMQFQADTAKTINKHTLNSFRPDSIRAPFTIILLDSVVEVHDTINKISEHHIPDMQDLLNSVVLYRTIQFNKLRGSDIKFLRRCLGLRAFEVSKPISISREHFSRCENESVPLSSSLEILLRVFIFYKIAVKLGDGLLHRNITFQSGIDMILNIGNSCKDSNDSSDFVLKLRRHPVHSDSRVRAGSIPDFAWIRADA